MSINDIDQTKFVQQYQPSAEDLAEAGPSKQDMKIVKLHSCSLCQYKSSRKYNVIRHAKRIHETMKKPRTCCVKEEYLLAGIDFHRKDCYYFHCEDVHPHRRSRTKISRNIYKITGHNLTNNERKNLMYALYNENTESINNHSHLDKHQSLKNILLQKEEEIIIKNNHFYGKNSLNVNETYTTIDFNSIDNNRLTEHQRLYLQDIDFDSFPRLE
ncbi:hypothetical protein HZH68_010122 [Vespula germanica]|uniref:Uncharacterized protein n=1 Tax=Vespula germanica TaxID=30212 RepID=A0A834JYM1_VESGE|nr:hypothetical protein HZH68_010122 [Vespula germanica]